MWRAFFCAIGAMLVVIGVECLLIDSATWAASAMDEPPPVVSSGFFSNSQPVAVSRDFRPADWMPWSALLTGAVILIYAQTLKRPTIG